MKSVSRTTLEDTFIILMAACGVGLKPVVGPLTRMLSSALFIPAGALGGMIYMVWPCLGLLVTRKTGTATAIGLLEAVIVLVTGIYGSHGILTLITYVVPCLVMDGVFMLSGRGAITWLIFLPPACANCTGALLVGFLIMRMPVIPLLISLFPAFLAGGVSGFLARGLFQGLTGTFPQFLPASTAGEG